PLFKVFSTPFKLNYAADDLKKIIELFPPGISASKLTDYDGILSEFLILVHHCNGMSNLSEILKTSESFKHLLPNVNLMLRLVFTAPISTASNERAFSKLKLMKNYLRSTTSADRLQSLMLLNSNKDILDYVNITMLVNKWSLLKERRIMIRQFYTTPPTCYSFTPALAAGNHNDVQHIIITYSEPTDDDDDNDDEEMSETFSPDLEFTESFDEL
ncbi:zinc finger MYM-type protein 1-like, partial [Aphis craccivora]